MKLPLRLVLLLSLALAAAPCGRALSPAEADAGRALARRYADAIVGVELVVTMKGTTRDDKALPTREIKREVNGTVLTPAGLTVLSLGEIDPRASVPASMVPQVRFDEPEYKEVKLRLTDGAEIPARIVMKDEDLDLAFVTPLPPGASAPLPFVDLKDEGRPSLLATCFTVSRMGKQSQRAPVVRPDLIISILEKPRALSVLQFPAVGSPVFLTDGKVLGVALRQIVNSRAIGVVVLGASDLAEVARQAEALAAKPVEPAPVPAAPEAPAPAAEPAK